MLGDDTSHDRESEATSPLLRRVVRQKQLVSLGRRNAWTIVGDDDAHEVVGGVVLRFDLDDAALLHRLDRVVDQVDDDAPDLFRIDRDLRQRVGEPSLDVDSHEDSLVETKDIGQQVVKVRGDRARRRHAGELREFVHQRLQRLDFLDDCARAFRSQRSGRLGRRRQVPPQPFGGQLNGRERILDLVRESPRDFAPRRDLLRPDQRGDIVEHDDDAVGAPVLTAKRRGHDRQVELAPAARQRDIAWMNGASTAQGLVDDIAQRLQLRAAECIAGRLAGDGRIDAEQPHRG